MKEENLINHPLGRGGQCDLPFDSSWWWKRTHLNWCL